MKKEETKEATETPPASSPGDHQALADALAAHQTVFAWLEENMDRVMAQRLGGSGKRFAFFVRIGNAEPIQWSEGYPNLTQAVMAGITERNANFEQVEAEQVRREPRKPGGTMPPPEFR